MKTIVTLSSKGGWFMLCITVLLAVSLCPNSTILGEQTEETNPASTTDMKAVNSWVAEIGLIMRERWMKGSVDKKRLEEIEKKAPSIEDSYMSASLKFYRAVLLALMEDEDAFRKLENSLRDDGMIEPELFMCDLQVFGGSGAETLNKRIGAWDSYGEYCPLSIWGSDRDDRKAPAGKIDPPPPSVPRLDELSDRLIKAGDLYAKAGLLREAVDSYIESIYAESQAKPNPNFAPRWTKIAEWEMTMGQPQLAIRAYLKASYNDPDSVAASAEGITKALAAKAPENKPQAQRPKFDKETALAIASLYRESNLHPLALKVLASAQKETGADFTAQRQEIEKEWAKIVETHIEMRGRMNGKERVFLLGAKVVDVKDWATVHVNRPSDTFWRPRIVVDAETYFKTLETARQAWSKSLTGKGADFADAASSIEKLGMKPDEPGYAVCEYLRCRLLVQASQKERAQEAFMRLLASRACAPEAVLGLAELNKDDRQTRAKLEEYLALLLPASRWRTDLDWRLSKGQVIIDPPRPHIPKINVNMLTEAASRFESAGLYDKAWLAYVEAAYAAEPSWIETKQEKQTWISSDMAPLWQRAAENAWRAGQHPIALDYLAKAAIFGTNERFEKAKEILVRWKDDKGEKPEKAPKEIQQVALDKIVRLYAAMNMHPRALEVIETYKATFDKPDQLYQMQSDEWKAVIKDYSRATEKVVLFGVEITPDLDPATIRIPPACSSESVKEIAAKIPQILKKAAESTPPAKDETPPPSDGAKPPAPTASPASSAPTGYLPPKWSSHPSPSNNLLSPNIFR